MRWFKYTADIEFGKSDATRRMKSVEPLTILPKEDSPVVVFMGSDGKSATFFIADPTFVADGEGECNDADRCDFVTLKLKESRNEETFTSQDGSVSYDLKLLKLRREQISDAEAQGDSVDSPSTKGKDSVEGGGRKIADASRAFLPRLVAAP
jgi:hypothetical protein